MGSIPTIMVAEGMATLADRLAAAESAPDGPAQRQKIVVDLRCLVGQLHAVIERDSFLPAPDDGPMIPDSWDAAAWPRA